MRSDVEYISFKDFQSVCKYKGIGADYHGSSEYYATCRKPDNIPVGESWNKCDRYRCPYYGCDGKYFKMYMGDKLIATAERVDFNIKTDRNFPSRVRNYG